MYEQGFLCTKPLQLLMALNISSSIPGASLMAVVEPISGIDQDALNRLAPAFRDHATFMAFDTREEALSHLADGCKRLFIDDDTADQEFWRRGRVAELNLYEEGFATYLWPVQKLSMKQEAYWLLHKLATGWDRRAGYHRSTSNIWIQRPDVFRKLNSRNRKNLKKINTSLIDFIKIRFQDLKLLWPTTVLDSLPREQDIHVFAPTIGGGGAQLKQLMESLAEKSCLVMYKPHPHDKEVPPGIPAHDKIVIPRNVPLEFLVIYLEARTSGLIYVYSEGTSSSVYLKRNDRVCFLTTESTPDLIQVYDLW